MNNRAEGAAEPPYDPTIMMRIELLENLASQNEQLLRSMDKRMDRMECRADHVQAGLDGLGAKAEATVRRLAAIEQDVAVIKSNYATKQDIDRIAAEMLRMKVSLIMWVVSAVILTHLLPLVLSKLGLG